MADKNVLEANEILQDDDADKALKQDLDNLAKNINVKEASLGQVDALFSKLDSVDAEAKNRALQYALKNAKITVGNVEKSISEISTAFSKATEQEGSTWRIKVKEGAQEDDRALVEGFLNEKGSSLAYLIQLSSRSASLQASRGYGRQNAEGLVDVGVDKIFGNQTRRALAGLKDWIQGDYTKNVESMDVKKFTVDDVLKLKFISNALKTKIENEAEDEKVKNLWSDENYELKNKYTNNYALKQITVDDPKWEENKQYQEFEQSGKKMKKYEITSLEELPEGYKWNDPEKYDVNDKDSYPKVYVFIVDDVIYTFYSNGRCYNGGDNTMYNTKDIVEKLRKKDEHEGDGDKNEGNGVENLEKFNPKVFNILKKTFKEVLDELNLSGYQMTYGDGGENPKLGVLLKTKEKYGGNQKTKGEWVNLHNFMTEDGILDRDKLKATIKNMNDEYEEQVKLENQENEDVAKFLGDIKNTTYSFSDLFGDVKENEYYKAFFNEFPNGKLKIRSSTTFQGDKLKIELDKGRPNWPDWLRGHEIEKESLKGEDGKYSIEAFKREMKKIVDKIVEKNFS